MLESLAGPEHLWRVLPVASERYSQSVLDGLISKLDGPVLLRALGTNGDASPGGDETRATCPICRDGSRQSLVIEHDTHRVYCTNLSCAGSSMNSGGNPVRYFAQASGSSFDEAALRLAKMVGIQLEEDGDAAAKFQGADGFQFVEVGHYTGPPGELSEPAPMQFGGRDGLGRGIYIPLSSLEEFVSRHRSGVYRSHFLFNTAESSIIAKHLSDRSLSVHGDYFAVFKAATSSETVHAINQAIDLVERLKDSYNIPYDAVTVFYAGNGIEVLVDWQVFGIRPGPRLPEVFRRMTCSLLGVDPVDAGTSQIQQADLSVYHPGYLTNVPGTLVTSEPRDTFKIRMSYVAFKKLSYQRLNEFTQRRPDLPVRDAFTQISPKAREFYNAVASGLEREARSADGEFIVSAYYDPSVASGMATLKQLGPALLKRLFDENRQELPTVSPHLDRALAGGLRPGELYVITGFPGSGTSTFALQMMNRAAQQDGVHCFFVGLQRGVEELYKRSLSQAGRIPVWEIDEKRQTPAALYDDKDFNHRLFGAIEKYNRLSDRIVILEGSAAGSLSRLTQMLRDKREEFRSQDLRDHTLLLVIDSLQLMVALLRSIWSERGLAGEREFAAELASLDVQTLTGRLKAIARELDVAVLATLEFYGRGQGPSESAGCSEECTRLFFDTQFADTVMMLSSLGQSLGALSTDVAADPRSPRVGGSGQRYAEKLAEFEKQWLASEEFTKLGSEFALLNILKNRTGPAEKLAFVHHKAFATFEALDYKI